MILWAFLSLALYAECAYGTAPCDTLQQYIDQHENCTEIKETKLQDDAIEEYGTDEGLYPSNYTTIICKGAIQAYTSCMVDAFATCTTGSPSLSSHINAAVAGYTARFCKPGTTDITDEIADYLDEYNTLFSSEDNDDRCTNEAEINSVWSECSVELLQWVEPRLNDPFLDVESIVTGQMTASMVCVRNSMRYLHAECTEETYLAILRYLDWHHMPLGVDLSFTAFANYNPAPFSQHRSTCHVVGDPHLFLCGENTRTTCASPGTVNYFSNEFLVIHGTNDPACPGCDATVVTNVTIVFAGGQVYMSGSSSPATTLTDGSNSAGGVTIDSVNGMVRITHSASGTVIIIRGVQMTDGTQTFFFSIRASDSLIDLSSGLLIIGCNDAIDITGGGRRKREASQECQTSCSSVPEKFQDTCLYDCGETGDATYAGQQTHVTQMESSAEEKDADVVVVEDDDDDDANDKDGATTKAAKLWYTVVLTAWVLIMK